MTSPIKPYRINVPDSVLQTLQKKLELTSYPGETTFTNDWKYGASLQDVKRLVDHWQTAFDWRRAEAKLNQLPQFTTSIQVDGHEDDLQIHFVHQRSKNANSIPLLFVHGWASSFVEATKILPLLTQTSDDKTQSFHVIAPSLPNCGFSQRTSKPGFGILQHAEVCHKLMLQLGLTQAEKEGLKRTQDFTENGSGYNNIQKTRPHTLGFALVDSPIALLAWIYEKLRDWTDDYEWADDEVLTWISIYLFSEAGPDASIRLYYDIVNPAASGRLDGKFESFMKYNTIPLGLSYFPKDVIVVPSSWGRTLGPVAFERRHTEGGHFAAYEKPELLVADLRALVENVGVSFNRAG
ncbi:hypothetical protein SLS60_010022 [Paraconiothyrium brasiliense]|uniref:Epoxide hydrolase N-terminal domain-containing protein n=1 Tax=Paraconiothyrium brasiliense TaxID=300254 RepID=A0ABR3QT53_9PLEO